MKAFVLLALLCAQSPQPNLIDVPPAEKAHVVKNNYNMEDFHMYDEAQKLHGVPLMPKLFVTVPREQKKAFVKFTDSLTKLVSSKEISVGIDGDLNGIVLQFEDKQQALKVLNDALKQGYKASPIVLYDDVERIVSNDLIVKLKLGVKKSDYIKRLETVAEGKFDFEFLGSSGVVLTVKELSNPSNILNLVNLIADDKFWVSFAVPILIPLDGNISVISTVETASSTNLGQERVLKVEISVFDPKIEVKLDLLPQMGPSLAPFPYLGESWLDIRPPVITHKKTATRRIINVEYPFKYLQHGNFVFQPIAVSYEKEGRAYQVRTNTCRFITKSVLAESSIEDIQAESYTVPAIPAMMVFRPTKPGGDEYLGVLAGEAKIVAMYVFGGLGIVLLSCWVGTMIMRVASMFDNNQEEYLWDDLEDCLDFDFGDDWMAAYAEVSKRLNDVLVRDFEVSLYSLTHNSDMESNFQKLLGELNKVYMPVGVEPNPDVLKAALNKFCRERTL